MTKLDRNLTLAADFPAATGEQWRKLVDRVLKGAPFERLETRTHDSLIIEPLYDRAPAAQAIVGRAPGTAWTLMQRIDHPDPAAANAQALDDLKNGATGLVLVFAGSVSANGFGLDASKQTLGRALDGIGLEAGITIDLSLSQSTRDGARIVAALIKSQGLAPASVGVLAGLNPIGGFASTGRSPLPWSELSSMFANLVGELAADGFRGPFSVADGRIIHNSGGSEAQELAFALANAVAYLRALEASGMAIEAARDAIYFRLSADADQFLTTAKFHAVRKLWARIEASCGLAPKPALVMAETAWRMMSKRDAYANMLRTTIATAAAGFGGADAIAVLPHTAALGLPDALARRVARNMQLILLEESNLARVADPAAGSGALEALTDELCHAAWAKFQDLERMGGVWQALQAGKIQREVAAVCAERRSAIAHRTEILTGTNEFPDLGERKPAILPVLPVTPPSGGGGTIAIAALPRIRLAEPFEALREASDEFLARTGARPKIFLACLGAQAEFTPRATFAMNFFEAGGIEAVSGEGDASALGAAFAASHAALACLCGADKTYESRAAPAAAALKAAGVRQLYLAGRPGAREAALRDAGVQSFIYEGCDALAVLEGAYTLIG